MAPFPAQSLTAVRRWLRGQPSVSRLIELDAKQLFAIASDVRFHSRWVPLTRIKAPSDRLRVGESFSACTLGLVDRMTLTSIEDGVAHFSKDGPLLLGSAQIEVREVAPGVGRVTWTYDVPIAASLPQFVARSLAGVLLPPVLRIVIVRMEADLLANKHKIG